MIIFKQRIVIKRRLTFTFQSVTEQYPSCSLMAGFPAFREFPIIWDATCAAASYYPEVSRRSLICAAVTFRE